MKPFDLEKALAGAPVIHRNGSPVKEFFYSTTSINDQPIISVSGGFMRSHNKDGRYYVGDHDCEYDLFMDSEKGEGWVIVDKDTPAELMTSKIFTSQENAMEYVRNNSTDFVAVRIAWGEA